MMPDHPTPPRAAPALPDIELRETLDLLGQVVASVSDRVETQTQALDRLSKTAAEARTAAFAARSQTDPALFAEPVGRAVKAEIGDAIKDLRALQADILQEQRLTRQDQSALRTERLNLLDLTRREHDRVQRLRKRLPFMALLALFLLLGLALALPRVTGINNTLCTVLGGEHLTLSSGCAFFSG